MPKLEANSPFMGTLDRGDVIAKYREWHPRVHAGRCVLRGDHRFAIVARPGDRSRSPRRAAGRRRRRRYVFQFDWPTPIDGGKWGAHHGLDVPFIFDNAAITPHLVGTGAEPLALADADEQRVDRLRADRQSECQGPAGVAGLRSDSAGRRWCSIANRASSTIPAAASAACLDRCRMCSRERSASRCRGRRRRWRSRWSPHAATRSSAGSRAGAGAR